MISRKNLKGISVMSRIKETKGLEKNFRLLHSISVERSKKKTSSRGSVRFYTKSKNIISDILFRLKLLRGKCEGEEELRRNIHKLPFRVILNNIFPYFMLDEITLNSYKREEQMKNKIRDNFVYFKRDPFRKIFRFREIRGFVYIGSYSVDVCGLDIPSVYGENIYDEVIKKGPQRTTDLLGGMKVVDSLVVNKLAGNLFDNAKMFVAWLVNRYFENLRILECYKIDIFSPKILKKLKKLTLDEIIFEKGPGTFVLPPNLEKLIICKCSNFNDEQVKEISCLNYLNELSLKHLNQGVNSKKTVLLHFRNVMKIPTLKVLILKNSFFLLEKESMVVVETKLVQFSYSCKSLSWMDDEYTLNQKQAMESQVGVIFQGFEYPLLKQLNLLLENEFTLKPVLKNQNFIPFLEHLIFRRGEFEFVGGNYVNLKKIELFRIIVNDKLVEILEKCCNLKFLLIGETTINYSFGENVIYNQVLRVRKVKFLSCVLNQCSCELYHLIYSKCFEIVVFEDLRIMEMREILFADNNIVQKSSMRNFSFKFSVRDNKDWFFVNNVISVLQNGMKNSILDDLGLISFEFLWFRWKNENFSFDKLKKFVVVCKEIGVCFLFPSEEYVLHMLRDRISINDKYSNSMLEVYREMLSTKNEKYDDKVIRQYRLLSDREFFYKYTTNLEKLPEGGEEFYLFRFLPSVLSQFCMLETNTILKILREFVFVLKTVNSLNYDHFGYFYGDKKREIHQLFFNFDMNGFGPGALPKTINYLSCELGPNSLSYDHIIFRELVECRVNKLEITLLVNFSIRIRPTYLRKLESLVESKKSFHFYISELVFVVRMENFLSGTYVDFFDSFNNFIGQEVSKFNIADVGCLIFELHLDKLNISVGESNVRSVVEKVRDLVVEKKYFDFKFYSLVEREDGESDGFVFLTFSFFCGDFGKKEGKKLLV